MDLNNFKKAYLNTISESTEEAPIEEAKKTFTLSDVITKVEFEKLEGPDKDAFAGVSDEAIIGDMDGFTIIIDGDKMSIIDGEGQENQYQLKKIMSTQ